MYKKRNYRSAAPVQIYKNNKKKKSISKTETSFLGFFENTLLQKYFYACQKII